MAIRPVILAFLLLVAPAWACPELPTYPSQAMDRVGERVVVMGTVANVRGLPGGQGVVLEMNDPCDGCGATSFMALVRGDKLLAATGESTAPAAAAWLRARVGERVWIEGRIELANGQPQIVVTDREQIVALDGRGFRL